MPTEYATIKNTAKSALKQEENKHRIKLWLTVSSTVSFFEQGREASNEACGSLQFVLVITALSC